jgi:hypothetical protein
MTMPDADPRTRLDPLIGNWTMEVDLPGSVRGTASFAWVLGDRYVLQRSEVPQSDVPDGMCLLAPAGDAFTQHYFDSRGVVRIYDMQVRDGLWTLERTKPDFSPLSFWQRFEGRFSDDADTIEARWERSEDEGRTWELDFTLTHRRVR